MPAGVPALATPASRGQSRPMPDSLLARIRQDIVLYGALAANIGIGVAKFVAAAITGSSAMLSEGFHSCVDSLNQILLLYGKRRAKRPPDAEHPFGYGRELYFWSFVVALLIFLVGAGVSIYEGLHHIRHPEPMADPLVAYLVLAISIALEGTSWVIALREFREAKGELGWVAAVRESKDPATFTVLFEDSAALAGLLIAGAGVFASHALERPDLDGYASIAIGVVLALVAAFLAREAKGLLIGERADPAVIAEVYKLVDGHPAIASVNHVRTVHTAPDSVFVAISADFRDDVTMGEGERLIEEIEGKLKTALPMLSSIYIRPEKREDAVLVARPGAPDQLVRVA